jgi:hypothetical protein
MESTAEQSILLKSRIEYQRADFAHLSQVLDSVAIDPDHKGALPALLRRMMSPLQYDLEQVDTLFKQERHAEAWTELSEIRGRSRQLLEEARIFLGGIAIRKVSLDEQVAELAQEFARDLDVGVNWSPAIVISVEPNYDWPEDLVFEDNPADGLVRLPMARWDIWRLPLVAHDYGYWVAKRGNISGFKEILEHQETLANCLMSDNPPTGEAASDLIPELLAMSDEQRRAADPDAFRKQNRCRLQMLIKRQTIRTWRLIADAFAAYLIGPAYVHALLFLELDPASPFSEGPSARTQYLPAAARRAAVAFDMLRRMNKATMDDPYGDGLYSAELKLLDATWQSALQAAGNLDRYLAMQSENGTLVGQLYEAVEKHFGSFGSETKARWKKATESLVPLLRNGSEQRFKFDLRTVLNAAWWCRARFPDCAARLAKDCMRLLTGSEPVAGLVSQPKKFQRDAERLLESRTEDLRREQERMMALLASPEISVPDRNAVSGRFYRLLSERDFVLSKFSRLKPSLSQIVAEELGPELNTLREELLDFLAGIMLRKHGLGREICAMAEELIAECARMSGVNWASRVVLGTNPLFSPVSEIVHYRFPDWDIWSLPLMAHEFGHIAALVTPAFNELMAAELSLAAQGYPGAEGWTENQRANYAARRGRHLHEFFADSFAVYSHGPAFAYSAILLNFDPIDAFATRGNHPTHAERFDLIVQILKSMNDAEKQDEFDAGPYATVIERLQRWWSGSLPDGAPPPTESIQFERLKSKSWALKIFNILQKHYRLGVQYRAVAMLDVGARAARLVDGDFTPDLEGDSLRNWLNLAWAARVRFPERMPEINKAVLTLWNRRSPKHV